MAKKADQWFSQLCAEAGYTPEETQAKIALFNQIAQDSKLGPKFDDAVKVYTEDYSAAEGRLKVAQQDVKNIKDWYGVASEEFKTMQAKAAAAEAELANLKAGTNGTGFPDPAAYVTKDDLIKFSQDMGFRYSNVIKNTAQITAQHVARFGEAPDMEAIDKIAGEQNLPIAKAYEEYIKPRLAEADKKGREEWEKKRSEEIERDLRSRLKVPDSQPETAPLFSPKKANGAPQSVSDEELLATWNKATQ